MAGSRRLRHASSATQLLKKNHITGLVVPAFSVLTLSASSVAFAKLLHPLLTADTVLEVVNPLPHGDANRHTRAYFKKFFGLYK